VTPAEAARETEMMGRAYGMPADIVDLFNKMLIASPRIKSRGYFAYLDGDVPIAWSYLVNIPDSNLVLLGGAATLPEARGRGVYGALVRRRLADARADAARPRSSRPIATPPRRSARSSASASCARWRSSPGCRRISRDSLRDLGIAMVLLGARSLEAHMLGDPALEKRHAFRIVRRGECSASPRGWTKACSIT